jgi:predicted house-cleaning noncanonical NTP pyrophosphatase (MazG superfamily)
MTGRKLIRDLVPVNDGGCEMEPAEAPLRELLLTQKLEEEAEEVRGAVDAFHRGAGDSFDVAEELADVLEVVHALAELRVPGGLATVEHVRARKLRERGGFTLGRTYTPAATSGQPG